MIKSKKGYKISVLLSIVCWLTFIWLRTFTYMASYDEGTGAYSFLIFAVITLLGTFFYWSLLKPAENGSWFSILFDDELEDYIEKSGVPRITPHGFRHSHASYLIRSRQIDDQLIADRLGHTVEELHRTYAHIYDESRGDLKSVLDKLF